MFGIQGCQEGPVVVQGAADERRSAQSFQEFMHLDRLVSEEPCVPALEPLSSGGAESQSRVLQDQLVADPPQDNASGQLLP